jgi:hypothetical protein
MHAVRIFNKRKKDWTPPNLSIKRRNEQHIARSKNKNNVEDTEDNSSNNENQISRSGIN